MTTTQHTAQVNRPQLAAQLQETARELDRAFLDKQEIIRLMIISVLAGEHMVLVGPPGTAKSALVRSFSRLVREGRIRRKVTRCDTHRTLRSPS